MPGVSSEPKRSDVTYTIAPIPWGKYTLNLTCQVRDGHSYAATLQVRPRASEGQPIELTEARSETASEQEQRWEGNWGEERTFQLSH